METATIILSVGLLVFVAHMLVGLFERTRVPDVFFLILIGFVIGPVFHLVKPEDFGKIGPVFKTVALVVILFEGGLAIRLEDLRTALRGTIRITLGSYLIAAGVLIAGAHYMTGLPFEMCVFVGALLAAPAPSVVIPLMEHLGLKPEARTTLTLESALGESLGIVISLGVLDSVRLGNVQTGKIIGQIISSFVLALMIGALGGYLWSLLLNKMRRLQNAMFTTPSFIFIVYGLTEGLGFSGPVAVLAFSLMIENVELLELRWLHKKIKLEPILLNRSERQFFGEIVFLLKTFFFVFLGLSLHISDAWTLKVAPFLLFLLLASRIVSVRLCLAKESATSRDAALMAVMIPRGLAAAVLASAPVAAGMAGGLDVENVVNTVIVISIVMTALLIFLLERTPASRVFEKLFSGYRSAALAKAVAKS